MILTGRPFSGILLTKHLGDGVTLPSEMRNPGLEPGCPKRTQEPESCASTNSASSACGFACEPAYIVAPLVYDATLLFEESDQSSHNGDRPPISLKLSHLEIEPLGDSAIWGRIGRQKCYCPKTAGSKLSGGGGWIGD